MRAHRVAGTDGASLCSEIGGLQLSTINFLQILQHPDISSDLKSAAFTVLRRLCGTFGRVPKSCLINEDFKTKGEMPFVTRGYTDLWQRRWNGRKVAVKELRFAPDDDKKKITKVARGLIPRDFETSSPPHRGFVKK